MNMATTNAPHELTIEQLTFIKSHFAPGWAASLNIGPGWLRLVAALDDALFNLAPNYQIHQVKEKFGGLRFYYELPEPTPPECCADAGPGHSAEGLSGVEAYAHLRYEESRSAHERLAHALQIIVRGFEELSYTICEQCAAPARPASNQGWVRTLCQAHAPEPSETPLPTAVELSWQNHGSYEESSSTPRFRIYPNRGLFELTVQDGNVILATFESPDRARAAAAQVQAALASR